MQPLLGLLTWQKELTAGIPRSPISVMRCSVSHSSFRSFWRPITSGRWVMRSFLFLGEDEYLLYSVIDSFVTFFFHLSLLHTRSITHSNKTTTLTHDNVGPPFILTVTLPVRKHHISGFLHVHNPVCCASAANVRLQPTAWNQIG